MTQQAIQTSLGVTTYGSAQRHVEPDAAVLNSTIEQTQKEPEAAFKQTSAKVRNVQQYLLGQGVEDIQISRLTLREEHEWASQKRRFVGYTASCSIMTRLTDLSKLEVVLCGVINAGVNQIGSVEFQSSAIKQYRAEARKEAALAAKAKAQLYSEALGKSVGEVLHIEDVNPDMPRNYELHAGVGNAAGGGDAGLDPGRVTINAAVMATFALISR